MIAGLLMYKSQLNVYVVGMHTWVAWVSVRMRTTPVKTAQNSHCN